MKTPHDAVTGDGRLHSCVLSFCIGYLEINVVLHKCHLVLLLSNRVLTHLAYEILFTKNLSQLCTIPRHTVITHGDVLVGFRTGLVRAAMSRSAFKMTVEMGKITICTISYTRIINASSMTCDTSTKNYKLFICASKMRFCRRTFVILCEDMLPPTPAQMFEPSGSHVLCSFFLHTFQITIWQSTVNQKGSYSIS